VMRWIDDYCETGPENDFERVEKIANAALEYTPPAAPVHEDWGPGPHEYHSLPAPVRPVAWIDCKVQMPPPGVRVFFLHKDHDRVGFDTWFGDDFRWTPSHWMPIPPLTTTPSAQPAPVQEPVAWMHTGGHIQGRNPNWEQGIADGYTRERGWTPLYTTPPAQRQWVGLTDEDKKGLWIADQMTNEEWSDLFSAIEAKLKEKNNG